MMHSIEFTDDWRCFKAGDHFDFHPGVNLLVGDQGCGKSSLIKVIQEMGAGKREHSNLRDKVKLECGGCKTLIFDFEKENPRTLSYFGKNSRFQIAAMFSSHGECNTIIIDSLQSASNCLVVMDEPDTALSIRTCKLLVKRFKGIAERDGQVIAAVHNMAVIQAFNKVLSLEHRKWMTSAEFILDHVTTKHCDPDSCRCEK